MQPQENSPEAQALKELNRKPRATKTPLTQDEIDAKAQTLLEIAKTETDGKLDPAKVKIWAQNTEKDAAHRNGKVILGVRPDKKFLHYTELAITMNHEKITSKIAGFLDAYTRLTAPAPRNHKKRNNKKTEVPAALEQPAIEQPAEVSVSEVSAEAPAQ